ncbi:MAG TPA: hypothetical protein VFF06_01890 [Polyangia bacterium]|nr:hypothetical protein [Polyangia bacterium]
MRVGDSLSIYYALKGPLPAGAYHIHANAYTPAADAMLRADLLHRAAGGDALLGGIDSTPQPGGSLHLAPWLDGTVTLPALDARAGDGLVLRIAYVSGSSAFTVIETSLTIP